jgi:anhydro-N-acetylmuramic acid kinase
VSASRLILGLMSGTSVDAIDAALVDISGDWPDMRVELLAYRAGAWPDALRRRLLEAMAPGKILTADLCELNILAARQFARTALNLMVKCGINRKNISAIASHGQTICHLPPGAGRAMGSTLQIGDPSVIATLTGITTVGDFRLADMALGGQGAPLTPIVDWLLLRQSGINTCIQNIGGIGNVTWLDSDGCLESVRAFDTGPGNMLIDALIYLSSRGKRRYDRGGKLGRTGKIHVPMLKYLQGHRFFKLRPPRSTGREDFGIQLARQILARYPRCKPADAIATACELTAWSMADAYQRFLPDVVAQTILCGGGADNSYLFERIQTHLRSIGCPKVRHIDHIGLKNKAREALAFAVLGALTLDGKPGNLPAITGATKSTVLGVVAHP